MLCMEAALPWYEKMTIGRSSGSLICLIEDLRMEEQSTLLRRAVILIRMRQRRRALQKWLLRIIVFKTGGREREKDDFEEEKENLRLEAGREGGRGREETDLRRMWTASGGGWSAVAEGSFFLIAFLSSFTLESCCKAPSPSFFRSTSM